MANFYDLNPTQTKSSDGKYIDLVFTGLVPDTDYGFTFAWIYEDPKLGKSGESNIFNFKTIPEPTLAPPKFTANDLKAINSLLYITWGGLDASGLEYETGKIKQVNIWIKGGDFGESYVLYGKSFTKASTIQISTTKKATYYVKLQAETNSGQLSGFSDEQYITLLKQPGPATNVTTLWVKDDLEVKWDFNSSFVDANTDNTNAREFLITFYYNNDSITINHPINKTSTSQRYVFERSKNVGAFGVLAKTLDVFIQVIDIYNQVSVVVQRTSVTYETTLTTPVISATAGTLSYSISWNAQDMNILDNVYVYEDVGGGYYEAARGTSNPLIVPAGNTQTRSVKVQFFDRNSSSTSFSNIVTVTPNPSVSFTDSAPTAPGTLSGTSGIDSTGAIGFNGYINFSWTAGTSTNIRGYRIRFRPYKSSAPYEDWSYVDSPGTATTYRLTGLAIGTTYEIAVASYNEFNKESLSYTAGSNVTVSGTPFIGTNVTTSGYFAANSGNDVGTFKFGYGVETGKRGLRFNDDNYWYIDSGASAAFKLGGDSENYIQWNGQAFIVQGDIRAKKGNFSGGVEIKSGGSLFSGVMNQAQTGITGAGYILNNTGLKFNSASISDITTISATDGKFVTKSAEIGQWVVNETTISKNGITLDSSGSIIANKNAYYIGIKPSPTDTAIVLWAGQSADGTTNPAFKVTAAGKLYATGAVISGDITLDTGSGLSTLIGSKSTVYRGTSAPTGGTYKAGDIWINTSTTDNVVYTWNTDITPNAWTIIQNSAQAQRDANTAKGQSAKFDSTSGNLVQPLTLSSNSASIYSTKTSWSDVTNGWFLGWKEVSTNNFTPSINIGGSSTYLKYATDTGLQLAGNIAVSTGDYWNNDGTFRFGGTSGIKREVVGGKIYLGSDTIIQGSITANSLDTTYTDIDTAGNLTIVNGTKTTTLSNNATLTMTDTSTGWDTGAAISINSQSSGYYGTESTTLSMGGNRIQLSRNGGSPSANYQSWIAHADELAGVSRGTLLITTGTSSGITLKPNGGVLSSTYPVYIYGRLDASFGGIVAGAYIAGNTTYTSRAIRNITVDTAAPSGGSEGDIWIQI